MARDSIKRLSGGAKAVKSPHQETNYVAPPKIDEIYEIDELPPPRDQLSTRNLKYTIENEAFDSDESDSESESDNESGSDSDNEYEYEEKFQSRNIASKLPPGGKSAVLDPSEEYDDEDDMSGSEDDDTEELDSEEEYSEDGLSLYPEDTNVEDEDVLDEYDVQEEKEEEEEFDLVESINGIINESTDFYENNEFIEEKADALISRFITNEEYSDIALNIVSRIIIVGIVLLKITYHIMVYLGDLNRKYGPVVLEKTIQNSLAFREYAVAVYSGDIEPAEAVDIAKETAFETVAFVTNGAMKIMKSDSSKNVAKQMAKLIRQVVESESWGIMTEFVTNTLRKGYSTLKSYQESYQAAQAAARKQKRASLRKSNSRTSKSKTRSSTSKRTSKSKRTGKIIPSSLKRLSTKKGS